MEQKLIAGPVTGYKMVDKNLCCRGMQYKIGETVYHDGPLEMCESGLHFCTNPSGVWAYYSEGRMFRIEAFDVLETSPEPGADEKKVCRGIRLVEEITVDGANNTGHSNTGHSNTGDSNTGDSNTGDSNTGDRNTGHGNVCDNSSGHFNTTTPPLIMFDLPADFAPDMDTVSSLAYHLSQDKPFNTTPFLSLPNATTEKILALHQLHITKRKASK